MKNWIARFAVLTVAIGVGLLGMTPASATGDDDPPPNPVDTPPNVTFDVQCGYVDVHVGGAAVEGWRVRVGRTHLNVEGGTVVEVVVRTPMDVASVTPVGAGPGDVFSASIERPTGGGLVALGPQYTPPDGCHAPALQLSLRPTCLGGLLLRADLGSGPELGGFTLKATSASVDFDTQDLTFAPGPTEEFFPAPPGQYELSQRVGDRTIIWARTTQTLAGCGADSITTRFTDACDSTEVVLNSELHQVQIYTIFRNLGEDEDLLVADEISVSATRRHEFSASPGDVFTVLVLTAEAGSAELREFVAGGLAALRAGRLAAKTSAVEQEPGIEVVTEHAFAPPAGCPTGGGGGSLPITGFEVGLASALGLVLLITGGGLYLVARRRRVRFTS